ncbi:MAG TPA: serine hydrolase domain-containing protein [Chitinophagaceae bacterium]|jgi:CubicO group peptidase (beta-lactamase class C family)|nr:serine hydrolase domain-containing protein [Chitinophagaceae bacterium]
MQPYFCTRKSAAGVLRPFLFCFLLLAAGPASRAQGPDPKAGALLGELMQKEHIPGLAYAVVQGGKTKYLGTLGLAHIPFRQPVTPETAFQLASCSKIYCALLLGRLFDAGLLRPGDRLGNLIDSVPEAWKDITVRQLAAHQSGLKFTDFSGARTGRDAYILARNLPLEYTPGTRDGYLSADYWVLQYVIEKTTGGSYYAALQRYVLEPLGLRHTFVNNPKLGGISDLDIIPQQAQEYHWFPEDSTLRISQMWFTSSGYTAGGIYSSVSDLARVAEALDDDAFLSPAAKALLRTPVPLANGKPGSFGLGFVVNENYQGRTIVEHSGGPALADFIRFEKEQLTVIVLTNNRGVWPYLGKTLATLYVKGLERPVLPK